MVGEMSEPLLHQMSLPHGVYEALLDESLQDVLQKHPELRRLLPGFLGSEDAWQSAFGSATLCAIAACIHLIAVTAFDAEGAIALMAKLATYFFLVMGVTLLAQSLDGFVRLLLSRLSEGEANWDSVVGRVRRIGTVIVATIAFVAALATIVDVFFLDS